MRIPSNRNIPKLIIVVIFTRHTTDLRAPLSRSGESEVRYHHNESGHSPWSVCTLLVARYQFSAVLFARGKQSGQDDLCRSLSRIIRLPRGRCHE